MLKNLEKPIRSFHSKRTMMRTRLLRFGIIAMPLLLGAWTLFHIELVGSLPRADQVLPAAPQEVWLKFSTMPDTARSTFSIRGPAGGVDLGEVLMDAEADSTVLKAVVEGEMPPGAHTVSWVAAPMEDHAVRGRFSFTIGSDGSEEGR